METEALPPSAKLTASLTSETLPAPTASEPESLAVELIPVQSTKENSLTHRLQAPDKEATVRFTVDMSETLHCKLSMLAAKTGRKKVDQSADAVGGWVKRRGLAVSILLILCDR